MKDEEKSIATRKIAAIEAEYTALEASTITYLENLTYSKDAEIYALKEDQAVLSKQIEVLDTNKLELENTIREQHSELRQLRDDKNSNAQLEE